MSNYGEIVEPATRSAWEDWDDEPSQNITKLKWQEDKAGPEIIESLLIFEGKYLYDCIFKQGNKNLQLINSVKEVNLHMYRITTYNKYIVVVKDYNLLQSSEIMELLKQYVVQSHDVMVVQTKPLAEYQSMEVSNQNYVIRTVCTTKPGAAADTPYPRLEQPNMITGVAAGVISMREHLGLSGIAIICFVEQPGEHQVEEMNSLLKQLNIEPVNAGPSNILNSNLYI